jgi:hypothetical protein
MKSGAWQKNNWPRAAALANPEHGGRSTTMKIAQYQWTAASNWQPALPSTSDAQLVLVFGGSKVLDASHFAQWRQSWPSAIIVGCTTAGEIQQTLVSDDSIAVTAIHFAHTTVRLVHQAIDDSGQSNAIGAALAQQLPKTGLRHVLAISDGLQVNGTDLVEGLKSYLPDDVLVTGGLAGDGADFKRTQIIADAVPRSGEVAAIGFYGDQLRIGCGSLGGWDTFGPDRLITKSKGNVLYELDGQSALELYKRYLGEHASGLPATGLLFPLALRGGDDDSPGLVRTILAVNEEQQSMTFAGDMPEGMYARLMRANFDRLIEGAAGAAQASISRGAKAPELAILISCVGRKLVLGQRTEEELESVRDILGPTTVLTGFYSYGEISPYMTSNKCELHNQTMTITTFSED